MRALVLNAYGEALGLMEVPRPVPGAGQVLVRVGASGVNPLDLKISKGTAPHARMEPPAILGIDLAGTVESVGPGVTAFKIGNEVFGMTGGVANIAGSLAEFAAVDARLLAMKPFNLTIREAAAIPLAFITAWEGLVDRADVREGQRVLVHGGAGGVGQMAVQLAKARGAHVFATVSKNKRKIAEQLGATAVDRDSPLAEYVRECTGDVGFDIVFDTVGGAVLDASFLAIRRYTGHVVSALGWGTHSLAPLSFRGGTYSGVFTLLPLLTGEGRAHHGEILREAAKLVEANELRPLLDERRFTMDSIAQAHATLERGEAIGKIVIDISE